MTTVAPVASNDLSQLLAEQSGQLASGIVNASRGRQRRLFCLHRGRLIFATSNVVEEQYELELLKRGLLDQAGLTQAREAAASAGQKLSQYLLVGDVLTAEQLRGAMNTYAAALLRSTMAWPSGHYVFSRGRPELDGEPTGDVSTARLVWEHLVASELPVELLRVRIGPPGLCPYPLPKRTKVFSGLRELAPFAHLLDHCDGLQTPRELVESAPTDERETVAALLLLVMIGAVEVPSASTDDRTVTDVTRDECMTRTDVSDNSDHYRVLGLDSQASSQEVREAYYDLARRFHPDRFRSGPLQDLLDRVESFFSRVTQAHNALGDPERRREYDAQLEAQRRAPARDPQQDAAALARMNFHRAKELIDKRKFQDAVRFLENAVQLESGEFSYRYELGLLLAQNPRRRKDAEEHLREATRIDPSKAAPYFALGELLRKMSREEEAVAQYQETLRWDPGHAEAKAALAELGTSEETGRGFLRNLFKS